MNIVYSPRYHIDIGTHVFPTRKYQLLHDRIRGSGRDGWRDGGRDFSPANEANEGPDGGRDFSPANTTATTTAFLEPEPASWDDLALVHTPEYLKKLQTGELDISELAQLEVPWSPDVVEGFRLMTGGTIHAARLATIPGLLAGNSLSPPVSFHIGGGFHHAFANHGEGFCLFNDVAVAIEVLLRDKVIERAGVVDLDVHHGNGTSLIFDDEPCVFTFSMHQQHNYPVLKPRSSLDVGLEDGAEDAIYLERLPAALDRVFAHDPHVVFYLAGADPYKDDQLGGLALTKAGLRARDQLVIRACMIRNIPLVIVLAGGYARKIEDTVDIHYATFEETQAGLTHRRD